MVRLYNLNFIIFVVLIALIIFWYRYVFANAYHIKINSLTPCYYTFIFHCFLVASNPTMTIIDIIVSPDEIFQHTIPCAIYGRAKFVLYACFTFSVIVFSGFKVRLYRSISNILSNWEFRILKIVIFYGFIDIPVGLILFESKLEVRGDMKLCLQLDGVRQALAFVRFIWLTVVYYWMVRIFSRSKELIEFIPMFRHQINLNSKWVPIIFSTTWCIQFGIWTTALILENLNVNWARKDILFIFQNIVTIDLLLNNVIMYSTIYGSKNDKEDSVDLCYTGGVELVMEERPRIIVDLDDLVWVSLPSCHPMKLARVVTEELNIQEYVVTDPTRIAIFQKHQEVTTQPPSCFRSSKFFLQFIRKHERENMTTVTRSRTPANLEEYIEEEIVE